MSGEELKQLRLAVQLTQEEVAQLAGMQRVRISELENDKLPLLNLHIDKLAALSDIYNIEFSVFVGWKKQGEQ